MRRLSFAGKLVVVTGASSGLGRDIARLLVWEEGARVVLAARRAERLHQIAAELNAGGMEAARAVPVDLLDKAASAELIHKAETFASETGAPLFGLVNNAGVTWYGPASEMPDGEAHKILALNLQVPIELSLAFAKRVLQPGVSRSGAIPAGAILNVTSLGAHVPVPFQSVYAGSKHGLQAFSESFYAESAPGRLVVTAVGPGGVQTEMIDQSGLSRKFGPGSAALADSGLVARKAIAAWKKRRISYVPGFGNKLAALAGRIFPPRMVGRASARVFDPEN